MTTKMQLSLFVYTNQLFQQKLTTAGDQYLHSIQALQKSYRNHWSINSYDNYVLISRLLLITVFIFNILTVGDMCYFIFPFL
jgi:hypothetical protein